MREMWAPVRIARAWRRPGCLRPSPTILHHTTSPHTMSRLRNQLKRRALEQADSWARETVEATFAGDTVASADLAVELPDDRRGEMAVLLWRAKIAPAAYRAFLEGAWQCGQREVTEAAKTRRRLAAMFRHAGVSMPEAG
jgi:hypothetical protein